MAVVEDVRGRIVEELDALTRKFGKRGLNRALELTGNGNSVIRKSTTWRPYAVCPKRIRACLITKINILHVVNKTWNKRLNDKYILNNVR